MSAGLRGPQREGRIRVSRVPARESLEEFEFDHARGVKRDTIAHLGRGLRAGAGPRTLIDKSGKVNTLRGTGTARRD